MHTIKNVRIRYYIEVSKIIRAEHRWICTACAIDEFTQCLQSYFCC